MARPIHRLSTLFVRNVAKPGRHADGAGLYLDTNKGSKRWIFLFRWEGKSVEMSLGPASKLSLVRARELAAKAREQVALGIHPVKARETEQQQAAAASNEPQPILTFGAFAETYIASVEGGWRNAKHRQQWRNSLRDHAATLKDRSIADIATEDVLAVLRPIWLTKPETASRVRGRIEKILSAAKALGHRSIDTANPAQWHGHLEVLLPKQPALVRGHHPAMPYEEVPRFLQRLRNRPAVAARALEFLVLGAMRSGEVLGARRREIDLQAKVLVIPPGRMKAGVAHTVVLTPPMLDILASLDVENLAPESFVFPGSKPGSALSNMAMEMLLRRMNLDAYTVHGFRSSFKDWAINETEFPDEISEESLAHIVGSKVRRAYRRGEALARRRQLMASWADFCNSAPVSAEGDE